MWSCIYWNNKGIHRMHMASSKKANYVTPRGHVYALWYSNINAECLDFSSFYFHRDFVNIWLIVRGLLSFDRPKTVSEELTPQYHLGHAATLKICWGTEPTTSRRKPLGSIETYHVSSQLRKYIFHYPTKFSEARFLLTVSFYLFSFLEL